MIVILYSQMSPPPSVTFFGHKVKLSGGCDGGLESVD